MRRTEGLQETRLMRFEDAYEGWTKSRLTQEEAALLLGVCPRTFRRYIDRYEEEGLVLQIPADRHRCHYVKAKVKVLRYTDGTLSIQHGPLALARYNAQGQEIPEELPVTA